MDTINNEFDANVLFKILTYLIYSKKWKVGNAVHIGNNEFDINVTESSEVLAGRGGTYRYGIEDGGIKFLGVTNGWMS